MIFKILPTKNYKSWPHSFNGPNFTFYFSRLSEVLIEKKWELICRNLSQFKNNIIYLKFFNFKCEITIWGWDYNKKQDLISVKQERNLEYFLKHKNSSSLPAVSCNAKMRTVQK